MKDGFFSIRFSIEELGRQGKLAIPLTRAKLPDAKTTLNKGRDVMLTYLLAVTCFSVPLQDSIDDHAKRYNSLREVISSLPDEKKLRVIISESEVLLNGPLIKLRFGEHIRRYLELVKKDAQFIIDLKSSEREVFFKNLDKVRKIQGENEYDIKLYNERAMGDALDGLKKTAINGSLIVYRVSSLKESFDIVSNNGRTKLSDLDASFDARRKILGDSNPELCHNLQMRVLYYYKDGNEEKLKETLLKINDMMPDDYPGAFGDKLYGNYLFLKYLVDSMGKINDAYTFYKTMDHKKISDFKRSITDTEIALRCAYFQNCVKMFSLLNSRFNMMDQQENYLKALKVFYKNEITGGLKQEATILRDMLAKSQEIKEVRRIEKEYDIVPLPKQAGEE